MFNLEKAEREQKENERWLRDREKKQNEKLRDRFE